MNVNRTVIHNTYVDNVHVTNVNVTNVHTSFNGGIGGIQARPARKSSSGRMRTTSSPRASSSSMCRWRMRTAQLRVGQRRPSAERGDVPGGCARGDQQQRIGQGVSPVS